MKNGKIYMNKLKKFLVVVFLFIPIMMFFPGCSCSGDGGNNNNNSNATYTVTFYTMSPVTFNIPIQEVKDGDKVIEPKRPSTFVSNRNENDEVDGYMYTYTFIGWYEDMEYTKLWLFSNEVHGNLDLIAKWKIQRQ